MADSDSPQFSRLIDWLEGRLSKDDARAFAEQLQNIDEATQADVDWLRAFQRASQSITLASPPPAVRDLLRRRFAAYAETRRPPDFFRRLLAYLTFDSRAQWAIAGARSAATEGQQRQLIYNTELAEVAVNIQPRAHDQRLDVIGQIFPTAEIAPEDLSVQLLREASQVGLTTTDDLGEFVFKAIPAGEYEIVISGDQIELVLSAVPLQP